MDPLEALSRYPLFSLLGRPVLQAWRDAGRVTVLDPGQSFFTEGQKGRHACVLLSGRVRLSRSDEGGQEKTLGMLDAGAVFGEYALLPPHLNTVTCRASEPSRVLLLPLSVLEPVTHTVPGICRNLKRWLRLHALVHHFRYSAGLCFLTALSLVPLLDRGREMHFVAGHTVQTRGLLDDGWLIVLRGAVRIGDAIRGRTVSKGECFGEQLLARRGDLLSAVAVEDSTCWYLSRAEFERPFDSPVSESLQTVSPVNPGTLWEWVRQRERVDCGAASLTMAVRGLGLDVTYEQIAASLRLTDVGASVAELMGAAAKFGVRGVPVRITTDQLASASLPAVAHMRGGHFVTVFEFRGVELVVGDPATGIRVVPLVRFRHEWSGTLLLLQLAVGP